MTDPWKCPETLRTLYHEKGLRIREIAERLGTTHGNVWYYMDKYGIDREDHKERIAETRRSEPAPFRTNDSGYEIWRTRVGGDLRSVRVHRLLAVLEYGFDAVKDKDVHHKNSIPWLNTADNIEVMGHGEHSRQHNLGEI